MDVTPGTVATVQAAAYVVNNIFVPLGARVKVLAVDSHHPYGTSLRLSLVSLPSGEIVAPRWCSVASVGFEWYGWWQNGRLA